MQFTRVLVDREFFFNDTATTEIYTLSLHDALPIYQRNGWPPGTAAQRFGGQEPLAGTEAGGRAKESAGCGRRNRLCDCERHEAARRCAGRRQLPLHQPTE